MAGERESSAWKSIPGLAKIIILVQTAIIFFLSFWIYEEFQRNIYLQAYVNGLLGGEFILIAGGSIAFFSSLIAVLYARLHKASKELREVLSAEAPALIGSNARFLDRRTEEHLIELIRKKNQAENLGTTENTPVQRRVDQNQGGAS